MNDTMNEITAFSPFGGRLVLEEVKGAQERANVPENSIETKAGDDRSMYVYVPASGCPDAKQTQVVMFLRDGADEASAQAAMKEYGLDALAEKGIPAFGPNKAAAILEGSKVFSKNLMKKYGIPTAAYETFADAGEAAAYVRANRKYPLVVKADGLALGVQWHPENLAPEHPDHAAIFTWLVDAAAGGALLKR